MRGLGARSAAEDASHGGRLQGVGQPRTLTQDPKPYTLNPISVSKGFEQRLQGVDSLRISAPDSQLQVASNGDQLDLCSGYTDMENRPLQTKDGRFRV